MADSCNWVDDGGTSRQGLRIVEVGWTEREDAQDALAIEDHRDRHCAGDHSLR